MKLNDINGLTLDYTQAMMAGLCYPDSKNSTIWGWRRSQVQEPAL